MAATAAGENSRLTGVRKKGHGKFAAAIKHPVTKTLLWLRTYQSPEVATCAYDLAARELKGAKAKLNFPYPPPARLIKEVISTPRHRSHGHDTLLFQVVMLPPDPTAPPPPPPKLAVYFPFPFEVPASDTPPVPAYPFRHMPLPARARLGLQPTHMHAPAPQPQQPIRRMQIVAQAESCLSSSCEPRGAPSRHLVFKKPKLFVVPVTPSAPTEGTDDNFTKPWYFPGSPTV
ncbi:ethylene-responsive transcription factor ABI4-like [Triticum dicoccoides]|uniref:ethylene-responsive transcription factor ABI4-like n=1 Tax=Triticum dicoccoides TaxID=85692 RepID=UPI001890F7B3|nr:ethylene-responsive transcription factor ABI4-like [Triticum dicoccoides]